MTIDPYLHFNGRCEEAISFYKEKLGATVQMMLRFKDMPPGAGPMAPVPPEMIMHAALMIGGTRVLMSDGRCEGNAKFEGFSLTINAKDAAEAQRLFDALADGGKITMPITKTFFSPAFGMVHDRFGVSWMVIVH